MTIFGYTLRKASSNLIQNSSFINKINEALLGLGFSYVIYDANNKTYIEKGYNLNTDVYAVISQKSTEVQRIPYFIKNVKDMHQKERYSQLMISNKSVLTPQQAIKKGRLSKEQQDAIDSSDNLTQTLLELAGSEDRAISYQVLTAQGI